LRTKTAITAIALVLIVVSLVAVVQAASCTEANPDWVYVTTITGNKSQNIDIDALIPTGYHWGIRGSYTADGYASITLNYDGQKSAGTSNNSGVLHTWKFDFEPNRYEPNYGNGPFRIEVSNVINYTLNIYYDANLIDVSPTPSPSPTQTPSSQPFPAYAVVMAVAAIVVAVALVFLYLKIKKHPPKI
jgi:hypothetical protein